METLGKPSEATLVGLNRAATTARLLSGAMHEVNNALQVIAGTVEILETLPDLPPAVSQSLERLRKQSHRAAAALADVQAFTRADRQSRIRLNLRELASHSIGLRHYAIRRARLEITFQADDATSFLVVGNRGDLQQAILNLLMNAEDALSGRPGGRITVSLAREDDHVALRVADTGNGLGSLPAEAAFAPFVTSREVSQHAGLGLWAARSTVAEHGGSVAIEPGADGTTVTMRLPAAPAA